MKPQHFSRKHAEPRISGTGLSPKRKRRLRFHQRLPTDNLTSLGPPRSPKRAVAVSTIQEERKKITIQADTIKSDISSSPQHDSSDVSWPMNSSSPIGKSTQHDLEMKTPTRQYTSGVAGNSGSIKHPSSDDNIFWAVTPNLQRQNALKMTAAAEHPADTSIDSEVGNLPSSPLKMLGKDGNPNKRNIDTIAEMLDPEFRNMIHKYNGHKSPEKSSTNLRLPILSKLPGFLRTSSDPRTLKSPRSVEPGQAEPIIASKSTLSESVTHSMRRYKVDARRYASVSTTNSFLSALGKDSGPGKNVSQMLEEIGSSLTKKMEKSGEVKEERQEPSSDEFSDDIDMEELDKLAEESKKTEAVERKTVESHDISFDDTFSDDGDEAIAISVSQKTSEESVHVSVPVLSFKDMKIDSGTRTDDDSHQYSASACILKPDCHRYLVKSVVRSRYKGSTNAKHPQLILRCVSGDESNQVVLVRDQWQELPIKPGDIVHVVTDEQNGNAHLVDNDHNLLIWHPDTLLSATTIAQSIHCQREAVINSKFRGPGEYNVPIIVGNIVHVIFQRCLSERDITDEFINSVVDEEVELNIIPILSAQSDLETLKKMLNPHIQHIKDWMCKFMGNPKIKGYGNGAQQKPFESPSSLHYKVASVLDVEENILSPMFGLRGLIDVVIEAQLTNNQRYVVPMEIKTGREFLTNRAQVSLYTLLIRERYGLHTDLMSLVYTKSLNSYFEALKKNDLRMLVNIRNQLSQFLAAGIEALPPIKKQASCERCPLMVQCMALNSLAEDGNAENSGIEPLLYNAATKFCSSPTYRKFYKRWNGALTKEGAFADESRRDLWCQASKDLEKSTGKCIGNLQVVSTEEIPGSRYLYKFWRDPASNPGILLSQLSKHDRIILSDEAGEYGIAYGNIDSIKQDSIVINTSRLWSHSGVKMAGFTQQNQVFEPVVGTQITQNDKSLEIPSSVRQKKYRIDKDELFHGVTLSRFNVLNLFLPDGDGTRRRLIVDGDEPKFSKKPSIESDIDTTNFNSDQLGAFNRVMTTEDYCLILGMPGTGKTTVIASIVKALANSGKTVLIAAYTHSAVDNIVEKVLDIMDDPKLLRVGYPGSIRAKLRKYSLYSEDTIYPVKNKEDFDHAIMDTPIVATTCMGINDTVFIHRQNFDYCIVDEASQVSMPVCLGPLAFADKFVLVGDHYQLPPLILSSEARAAGLDKSLFRILSDKHPESVAQLTKQYRMCADIMAVSNTLIYNGRLKCGNDSVANQSLEIPYRERIEEKSVDLKPELRWMDRVLDPNCKVIFLDHDLVPATEVCHGDKIENPTEASLIDSIAKSLVLCGVDEASIGIISFYRAQLRYFYRSLSMFPHMDIMTADRFQGRDKDCIIISMVRSNHKNKSGDLLREWRRVNVAMTRAKSKLVILGSRRLMSTIPQFEGFMKLFESRGWFYQLPAGADTMYRNFLEFEGQSVKSH